VVWKYLVLFLVVIVFVHVSYTAMASGQVVASVVRLPYVFSSASILGDGTVVGVRNGRAVFIHGVDIFKSIPLIGGNGVVASYPSSNPTLAVVYSSGGDVVVADESGNILYRTIVGFGRLEKASYAYGIVYMLVDTPRGKELYAYDIDARTWGYVSPIEENVTNSQRILLGSVIDMLPTDNGVVILYDPILPPGVTDYMKIPVVILGPNGVENESVRVVFYFKDYDFSYQTNIQGVGNVNVPIPVSDMIAYVDYNNTWYQYYFKSSEITSNGVVISVPGSTIVPPPSNLVSHYAVVLEGFSVRYVQKVGPASTVLAAYGSKIALYDSTYTTAEFIDMNTGSMLSFGLDSPVKSSAIRNNILAVLTESGSLYIFDMEDRSLLSTYSIPGGEDVGVSSHYVFVRTRDSIHMISLESLKDVFIYETAGLAVNTPYLYVAPNDLFMFSTKDSTIIVSGINSTEPFSFKKYIPYSVELKVIDPWNHTVKNVEVFVDSVYIGVTNDNGTIVFSLNPGKHALLLKPPQSRANVTSTQFTLNVTGDTSKTVVLNRTIYKLNLILSDPLHKVLREPVALSVNQGNLTVYSEKIISSPRISLWVKRGVYVISVKPTEMTPLYQAEDITITVNNDTTVNLTLKYKLYTVELKVIDNSNGEVVRSPVLVCSDLGCVKNTTLMLYKGKHMLTVKPLVFYNSTDLFNSTTVYVNVPKEKLVVVKALRSNFLVRFIFIDEVDKKVVHTPLTVLVGGIKYKEKQNVTLLLPKGKILLQVIGNSLYQDLSKTININRDGTYNITIPRRQKNLVIKVTSIVGSVKNGVIYIRSVSGVYKVIPLPPSGEVTVSLPIDWYTVKFESSMFSKQTLALDLAKQDSIILITKPSIKGFFLLYSNIIIASFGVILATGILYWMTRRTMTRIRSIKEISELLGEEYEEEEHEAEAESKEEEEK